MEAMNQTIREMLLPYPLLTQKFQLFIPAADREVGEGAGGTSTVVSLVYFLGF